MRMRILPTLSIVASSLLISGSAGAASHAQGPVLRAGLERLARAAGMEVGPVTMLLTDKRNFAIVLNEAITEYSRSDLERGVDIGIAVVATESRSTAVKLQDGAYFVNVTIGDEAPVMRLNPVQGGEPILLPATVMPDPFPRRGPRAFVATDGVDLQFGVYLLGVVILPEGF